MFALIKKQYFFWQRDRLQPVKLVKEHIWCISTSGHILSCCLHALIKGAPQELSMKSILSQQQSTLILRKLRNTALKNFMTTLMQTEGT